MLEKGKKRRVAIRHVDRGGLRAGGFETNCECKALIEVSAPFMLDRFINSPKNKPYKAAASSELNSFRERLGQYNLILALWYA